MAGQESMGDRTRPTGRLARPNRFGLRGFIADDRPARWLGVLMGANNARRDSTFWVRGGVK